MSDISELERRITAALARITAGLDSLSATPTPEGADATQEALLSEQLANAQLNERLRAVKEKSETTIAALEKKVEKMTQQLDVQGLELQRMRKTNIQLRETLRALREAQEAGTAEPHLLNKSMMAELEALRASRMAEMAEMEEILGELKPLIGERADD